MRGTAQSPPCCAFQTFRLHPACADLLEARSAPLRVFVSQALIVSPKYSAFFIYLYTQGIMPHVTVNCDSASLLPSYILKPAPPVFSFISDVSLSLLLPLIAYWSFSIIFQLIESSGLGDRLQPFNTPTEMLVRNRVSKLYAFFYIMGNFAIQGTLAWALSQLGDEDLVGREAYDIAVWAMRLRSAQSWLPRMLGVVGIDSMKLAADLASSVPAVAAVLAGGTFDTSFDHGQRASCSDFTSWEMSFASIMYFYLVPALQFFIAFSVTDVWQYFGHRLLHEWKWLYRDVPQSFVEDHSSLTRSPGHVHSIHHQLYVPWCWSAFYMHPIESILLDGISVALAFPAACLTTKQGMCFTTIVTFKAICDHAGYEIPWNPVYAFPYANDVNFHNLHHQSWGLKVSSPSHRLDHPLMNSQKDAFPNINTDT